MIEEERILKAKEGNIFVDLEGNIIGTVIYLGIYDSKDNYIEIKKIN